MIKAAIRTIVHMPTIDDYIAMFPQMPINSEQKQNLFEIITKSLNILKALIFVEISGSSPVVVYEQVLRIEIDNGTIKEPTDHEKQFVGAVVRVVMECNGWIKDGNKKQRFTKKPRIFSSGQLYVEK